MIDGQTHDTFAAVTRIVDLERDGDGDGDGDQHARPGRPVTRSVGPDDPMSPEILGAQQGLVGSLDQFRARGFRPGCKSVRRGDADADTELHGDVAERDRFVQSGEDPIGQRPDAIPVRRTGDHDELVAADTGEDIARAEA